MARRDGEALLVGDRLAEEYDNAFGFIRLLLASFVVISHGPELLNRNRDNLLHTRLSGGLTLGELAVDGFFIVSGYLVASSVQRSANPLDFLRRRALRIYPGFLCVSLLCLLVVAPLAGAEPLLLWSWPIAAMRVLALVPSEAPNSFSGLEYPALDGAAWTLIYEVQCYLLLVLVARLGLLRRPPLLIGIAGLLLLATIIVPDIPEPRLAGLFLAGVGAFQAREKLRFSSRNTIGACIGLLAGLAFPKIGHAAIGLFGTYLILRIARLRRPSALRRINRETDISYGLYLSAWPISNLMIYYWPGIHPITLIAATLCLASCYGCASWHLVERPALRRGRLPTKPRPSLATA